MSIGYALAMIAVAAVCTFATRVAPFLLFNGKSRFRRSSVIWVRRCRPAVIALLVVYCLKNVGWVTGTRRSRAAVHRADRSAARLEA